MVLNWIWIGFFVVAFLMAIGKTIFTGDLDVWSAIMNSSFDQAAFAFEISLGLTGVLTLWMGIMKIGERGGVIEFFGHLISPFFSRLFPGIPKGHPAMGAIFGEHIGQYARTRQRRHPDGTPRNAGDAVAQP